MERDSNATSGTSDRTTLGAFPSSSFQDRFIDLNRINGFASWIFYPGMLFQSFQKWWGRGGERATPHEGIDLRLYSTVRDEQLAVQPDMKVPSPYAGSVVGIIPDFIGQSVFVRHGDLWKPGFHLFTLFGHTKPRPEVTRGSELKEGEVAATIADASTKHGDLQSHLHISQAWIDDTIAFDAISWDKINDQRAVLIDPLTVLGLTHVFKEKRS